MLFSESRYDFQSACGPIFGMKLMQTPSPRGLSANHPKYRTTVKFGGFSPAYRLSEKNMTGE
jgi:hypothetical protein